MQNVVRAPEFAANKDVWLNIFGFNGDPAQGGGTKALEIEFELDIDVDNGTYTHKRPQTSTPKTDADAWDVFRDIWHNAGIDQPYQTLTLQSGGPALQVKLASYKTVDTADGRHLVVTFKEYRTTSATGTYKTRLGIS